MSQEYMKCATLCLMHKGLPKGFPERQQWELEKILECILSTVNPVKIVLFGSYARGDYVVRDVTIGEWGLPEVYESDFDLLVITETEEQAESMKIWHEVDRKLGKIKRRLRTPVSLIQEPLAHVNEQMGIGRYFYVDIRKEGRILYERDEVELAKKRKLQAEERRRLILEDIESWMEAGERMQSHVIASMRYAKKKGITELQQVKALQDAAFQLHQVTEKLYTCLWLAIKFYKPRTHDLARLAEFVELHDGKLAVFKREEEEGKRLFELLRKAYVDARYKKSYRITAEELSELMKGVKKLRKQVVRVREGL